MARVYFSGFQPFERCFLRLVADIEFRGFLSSYLVALRRVKTVV